MKISIALSLLILAIGSLVGWKDRQRLITVRSHHHQLIATASKAGITLDSSQADDGVRLTKRAREDKEIAAKQIAAEFIAFAKEMEGIEENGGKPDASVQKRVMEFMDRLMSLDTSQLKILIADLRAAPDLKEETRHGLIGFSIMSMASDHPHAALTILAESADLFKGESIGKHVISSSLNLLAREDPAAAVAWIRENGEKFPDLIDEDTKEGLIAGAASNDLAQAFKLITELGIKEPDESIQAIMNSAKTDEDRTANLAALRVYATSLTDEDARKNALRVGVDSLVKSAMKEDFQSATKWIEDAGLTAEQLKSIKDNNLVHTIKQEDTGKWIEWMGRDMAVDERNDGIRQMVRQWTQNDYVAAGEWLSSTPAGPAKNLSIRSYAETVAPYEPQSAVQWAVTLPAGKERDATLRHIYESWPSGDDVAREAFANQHGIK